jgi:hypothetical protein
MSGPSSNDPNVTSGSANASAPNMSFPSGELLTKRTVLRFEEYSRNTPSDTVTSATTAIINLPMPLQIPDNMSIKSGAYDMQFTDNMNAAMDVLSGGHAIDKLKKAAGSFSSFTSKDVARGVALAPLIVNDDRRTQAGIVGGIVKNPHTTTFFDGVNLRGFYLNWRFSPRSQQESDTLRNIINTIRERIHPLERLESYALDYPDLVYVDFEGESKEYLPKFYRSFITEVTVNSSVGEGMAFFKSGAPIYVELGIRFNETNIITRNVLTGNSQSNQIGTTTNIGNRGNQQ